MNGGWSAPLAYGPDTLVNNELGWKTLWFDRRLQWNGALYREEWEHAQIGAFDSRVLGGGTINGANYRVQGVETSLQASPIDGLTLEVSAAFNHSELVKEAAFFWADGKPIDFSSLGIQNPAGILGSSLAGAPAFQGNTVRAMSGLSTLIARSSRSAQSISRTRSRPRISFPRILKVSLLLMICRRSRPMMPLSVPERRRGGCSSTEKIFRTRALNSSRMTMKDTRPSP